MTVEPGRLNFVLPDFTRISWVSPGAQEVWEQRLRLISEAWNEICWQSVAAGVRRVFLTSLSLETFVHESAVWCDRGLAALPIGLEGKARDSYASTQPPLRYGAPVAVRVAVGATPDLAVFRKAWQARDDEIVGMLLGYPACCRNFFRKVWIDAASVDTTWAMAVNTVAPAEGVTVLDVGGPPTANILWRWAGVRAVPHLPCRFDCRETVRLGDALLSLGREIDYVEEVEWIEEILEWPVEWSALHGIAEIKTPILKISTRTDATGGKRIVRRLGRRFPKEGAQGLTFPFVTPRRLAVTDSPSFRRGMAESLGNLGRPDRPTWYHEDNGFGTLLAMERSQEPIVRLARATLEGGDGVLLDLGCGNGALLAKICSDRPDLVPYGIDRRPHVIEHAGLLLPRFAGNFRTGDLFEVEQWSDRQSYRLVTLMAGRVLEVAQPLRQRLLEALRRSATVVLVYVYPGWSPARFSDLLARAGFRQLSRGAADCALVEIV